MEEERGDEALINNAFYNDLGRQWYESYDHPVALLRAENTVRAPWVLEVIEKTKQNTASILDIGCGAGFLTNALAKKGHKVMGIDVSEKSLEIAKQFDVTQSVEYLYANAYSLPFEDHSYDIVCAMDVLEHIEFPDRLIQEASRVLKPGGLFFFHTFNRNFLSYLVIIKGVEWCVQNAPKNMHVYHLFIKPYELEEILQKSNLSIEKIQGLRPKFFTRAFWRMLMTRTIDPSFSFTFSKSLATGYCGYGVKNG